MSEKILVLTLHYPDRGVHVPERESGRDFRRDCPGVPEERSNLALLAWAQEAKLKARQIETEPVNIKRLLSIIPEIRKMTVNGTFI